MGRQTVQHGLFRKAGLLGPTRTDQWLSSREPTGVQWHPCLIRITISENVTSYDKWALLVFELNNLKNAKRFIELGDLAIAGRINRDQYAGECVALECKALVLTRMFFQHNAIPGATAQDAYYRSYRYCSGNDNDFVRMLKSSDADPDDNHKYFGDRFDSLHRGSIESWSDRVKSQLP